MPAERIGLFANNIEAAAEKIIQFLKGTTTTEGRDVIHFHGWGGLGASAVLKEVVKRLRSSSRSAGTGTAGGLELEKIIHVDCSRWQSKRSLQKAIATELELPQQVMVLFDQRDEEDDFDGVEESTRGVISRVQLAIMKELGDRRFLVVFHNGSGSYIDLWEVGVPVIGQLSKRVLWTSQGRFWPRATEGHSPWVDVELELARLSNVAIYMVTSGDEFDNILYAEADEVAKYTCVPKPVMSPEIVLECILYIALGSNDENSIGWESHASNYWVCDGIIQDATDGGRSAWDIGDALQRNMNWNLSNEYAEFLCRALSGEGQSHTNRWVWATFQDSTEFHVPSQATSFFWTKHGPSTDNNRNGTKIIEASLFEHSSHRSINLRVMHLSHCTFSFSSPPFLGCSNLRFLLLDHCRDKDDDAQEDRGEEKECHHHSQCFRQDDGTCFHNLWVLELSYTDWHWILSKDMLDLMADLRELNVKGVGKKSMSHLRRCSGAGRNSRKLLKLRVVAESDSSSSSANKDDDIGGGDGNQQVAVKSFPDLSSWHILTTVVLDGCGDLEVIGCDALPPSLESFSLISNVAAKLNSISFRGHTRLKSLVLRGLLGSLVELDMSGTAIKTLDLSAMQDMNLRRLFLLGCEKLRAIRWPEEGEDWIRLEALHIDTTTTHAACWDREDPKSNNQVATTTSTEHTSVGSSSASRLCGNGRAPIGFDWYISLSDPRLFRSIVHVGPDRGYHVEISSAGGRRLGGDISQGLDSSACGRGKQRVRAAGNLYSNDTIISSSSQVASGANRDTTMWIWDCPDMPTDPDWAHCCISIQYEMQTELIQGTSTTTTTAKQEAGAAPNLPGFVDDDVRTLHLHDSSSITRLDLLGLSPAAAAAAAAVVVAKFWNQLLWCRVERCPSIEGVVFAAPSSSNTMSRITTFYRLGTFWASQLLHARYIWDWSASAFHPGRRSFEDLVFLHVDCCPRLVHVLPLYASNGRGCMSLETLEIVCCGDLRDVFPPWDPESQQQQEGRPREFPSLRRIHLYDLPALQRICGRRMYAPSLQTVKIRGCGSLKRLPAVSWASSPWEPTAVPVVVECEKDWWDGLEWDGEGAGHHPSLYKPTHSAYYKKTQLRASVLR